MIETLPLELALTILEYAILDDTTTGARCARLSRTLSSYVTPMLYDTVVLRHWRSTRAFEKLLTGDLDPTPSSVSAALVSPTYHTHKRRGSAFTAETRRLKPLGLALVRHLSAPFLQLHAVPGRGEPIIYSLAARCPNLKSLQLLQLPMSSAEVQSLVTRCAALEELFVLVPYSGPVPAMRRLFFHGSAIMHDPRIFRVAQAAWVVPTTPSPSPTHHPSVRARSSLTHVSLTHGLYERTSSTLASVRTLLAYSTLQVLVVRLLSLTFGAVIEDDSEVDVKQTALWEGMAALKDPRVRAGVATSTQVPAAATRMSTSEPSQTAMVRMFEDHVRQRRTQTAEGLWTFGEQVWTPS
ncbi:hypothetical protein BKA62DRAFT_773693 [Auriculariales sp. MPI-PUGE-AT-0066]|nr:hypothetical protein BKA62DRAFT_773693 [Auriculariales sp. MPI-PUGE-AT-0066]